MVAKTPKLKMFKVKIEVDNHKRGKDFLKKDTEITVTAVERETLIKAKVIKNG